MLDRFTSEQITQIELFAADKHKHQKRRDGGPYFNHCFRVANHINKKFENSRSNYKYPFEIVGYSAPVGESGSHTFIRVNDDANWKAKNDWATWEVRNDWALYYASAILHDVIEDTNTDYDDVADVAGTTVANVVAKLTDYKHLPSVERHAAYLHSFANMKYSDEACVVKTVKFYDILDNTTSSKALLGLGNDKFLFNWSIRALDILRAIGDCVPKDEVNKLAELLQATICLVKPTLF